jgi:serine/threonine protein kinase
MAPEQWRGKPAPASDQYALGVVFYEMVTGRVPYKAETPADVFYQQTTQPLPPPRQFASHGLTRFTSQMPAKMSTLVPTATVKGSPTMMLIPTSIPIPKTGDSNVSPVDGMTLGYVPAGEFLMGAADTEPNPDK